MFIFKIESLGILYESSINPVIKTLLFESKEILLISPTLIPDIKTSDSTVRPSTKLNVASNLLPEFSFVFLII